MDSLTRLSSQPRVSLGLDITMLAVATLILTYSDLTSHAPPLAWAVIFSMVTVACLAACGMYRVRPTTDLLELCRAIFTATTLTLAVVVALRVFVTDSNVVARETASAWLVSTLLIMAARLALTLRTRHARHATLIVGAGQVGRRIARRLLERPTLGLKPVGFLDKEPLGTGEELELPVLGASWDLEDVVEQHGIEQVIVAFSTAPTEVMISVVERAQQLGVGVALVPRLYDTSAGRLTVERVGALPLISSKSPDPKGFQFALKYSLDRLLAALAIALLLPVFCALSLAVWISLGRPIFYRQERIGRDGTRFQMLKFRSMIPDTSSTRAEVVLLEDSAPGGVEGADRRTRVGALLRRWSLDELPQLLNVLKGEMSFVGPRPERPEFVVQFEQSIHQYARRHRVKSGITGWAQVHGLRGKTSLTDRVEWDNYYIENWSMWFDIKIAFRTLGAIMQPGDIE